MTKIKLPLCVDLDGTIIQEDITIELIKTIINNHKRNIFRLFLSIIKSRSYLKHSIRDYISVNLIKSLNFNKNLISILKEEKTKGRKIILVTGANYNVAKEISNYLGIFDEVIASNIALNLISRAKAEVLCSTFGYNKFLYIGNSYNDLEVFKRSAGFIAINVNRVVSVLAKKIKKPSIITREFSLENETNIQSVFQL